MILNTVKLPTALVYLSLTTTLHATPELLLPPRAETILNPVIVRLENRQYRAWDLTLYDPSTKQFKLFFTIDQQPIARNFFWERDWKVLYFLAGSTTYRVPWRSGGKLERYFDLPEQRMFRAPDFEDLWLDRGSNQWRFVETFTDCGTTSDPNDRRSQGNFYELSRDLRHWKLIEKKRAMCCDLPNSCSDHEDTIRKRIRKRGSHPLITDPYSGLYKTMGNILKTSKSKRLTAHLVSAANRQAVVEITLIEREGVPEAGGDEYEPHFAPPVTWVGKLNGERKEVFPKRAPSIDNPSEDLVIDWFDHWLALSSASSTRLVDLRTGEVVLEIEKGYAYAQRWVERPSEKPVE